ncbi:MAG: CehA/McbA family metallohydrolase [Candidatus Firestonebacteria bacterium]
MAEKVWTGDLHIHTTASDGDEPLKVLLAAKNANFDFLAITDHETIDGYNKVEEVRKKYGIDILLIQGSEIMSPNAHIVALDIHKDISGVGTDADVCRRIRKEGGFVIAAHPVWPEFKSSYWDKKIFHKLVENKEVDAVEVINYSAMHGFEPNRPVFDFYEEMSSKGEPFSITVGSDAHDSGRIGKCKLFVWAEELSGNLNVSSSLISVESFKFYKLGNRQIFDKEIQVKNSLFKDEINYLDIWAKLDNRKEVFNWRKKIDFAPCVLINDSFKIDDCMNNLSKANAIRLETVKMDGWKGPKDLNAICYLMWDKKYFYVIVDVTDDIFYQPYTILFTTFMGDSIQIGIDPFFSEIMVYKGYDGVYEVTLSSTSEGHKIHKIQVPKASGEVRGEMGKNAKLDVIKRNGGMLYQASMPFEYLKPLCPELGKTFGFSIIVNDNDGLGRKGFIEWAGGIGDKKSPALWGTATFVKG